MSTTVRVSALYEYPVKSCRGRPIAEARYDALGLRHDRRWMVVRPDGRFLSQREQPRLATIFPRITPEGGLCLSADGQPTLPVPVPPAAGAECRVKVWDDEVEAVDAGPAAAQWLQAVLDTPARLVHIGPGHRRPLKRDPGAAAGSSPAFADAYPFLLLSEASLIELNRRLPRPLPVNRFRPNIVVAGCQAFAEDGWSELSIGPGRFAVVSPCARCITTTTDQLRGERDGKEPLRTLARFRRLQGGPEVYFGQNLVHLEPAGLLRVGDPVQVLK